jgi:hypothetical protein
LKLSIPRRFQAPAAAQLGVATAAAAQLPDGPISAIPDPLHLLPGPRRWRGHVACNLLIYRMFISL